MAGPTTTVIDGEPSVRSIADQAPIGIFRADPAGMIVYINAALDRLSGVSASRALGKSWLRSVPRKAREEAERAWLQAVLARQNLETELRFNHPDGTPRYASILVAAERSAGGDVLGFIGFVTDITAQRADQAALRRSERLFRLLAENATDIIVRLDLDDHVTYASPAMEEVTGFSSAETRGINPVSFMHPDDAGPARECSRQLKAGEIEQAVIEYRTPHKKGHFIWVEARSRLVRNRRGEPQEVISVVRDISEHKKLESDLIAAREAEHQASAAQSRFLAAMSHEIRTPISGVIGMIDLLTNAPPDDAQQPRYRAALDASARTLLRVVDDVLDYSRLSEVGITLESESFDMFAAVHAVIDLYRPAAEAKGLILGLQFNAPVRDVFGDATRLSQILGNLMSNALKFTGSGRIDVVVETQGNNWCLTIRDTGIGMTTEQQRSLFQAFVQADPTIATRFGGTGLGLVITRLIVEAMGGSIRVDSVIGQGTEFAIQVPLATTAKTIKTENPDLGKPLSNSMLNLLVAEDNEVNRLYLTRLLEEMGHRVIAVTDGQKALDAARTATFDAILLDRHMPRVDGIRTAQAVRDTLTECPTLILVSAAAPGTLEEEETSRLFGAILPKPVRRDRLHEVLAVCIAKRPEQQRSPSQRGDIEATFGIEAVNELEQLFRRDIASRIGLLENAILDHDLASLHRHAHAISGAAQLIGQRAIAEAAARTETAAPDAVEKEGRMLRDSCASYLSL